MTIDDAPTAEETVDIVANLKPRRRAAKRHPLSSGDILHSTTPSLRSDVLPDPARNLPGGFAAAARSPPRRPLDQALLNLVQHSPPGRVLDIRLVSSIQSGKAEFSQVWRAEVIDGRQARPVVLKLVVEALFPYAAFSSIQGSIVPYCYGVYHFDLPFGETVVGFLLEDLTSVAVPLPTWTKEQTRLALRRQRRKKLDAGGNESSSSSIDSSDDDLDKVDALKLQDFKPFLDQLLQAFDTLHNCGRARFNHDLPDILVVGGQPLQSYVVFTSFAPSVARKAFEDRRQETEEEAARRSYSDVRVPLGGSWCHLEEGILISQLDEAFPDALVSAYHDKFLEERYGA
ncbi:hypothetical protein JCM8097_005023 [Rhodosporidiobolus ruineniae]